jgi:hypothetical protein
MSWSPVRQKASGCGVLPNSWFLLFDVRATTLVVVNESTRTAQRPEEFWADYLDRPQLLNL